MLNNMIPLRANGTIAPSVFVMIDTTADGMVIQATLNARTIGISQSGMKRAPGLPGSDNTIAAQAGDSIQLFGLGDVCMLQSSAVIVRGATLKSDANGLGLTTVTDTEKVGAIAFQSCGAANVFIMVQIVCYDL
jgi:hypothetical protein